MKQRTEPILPVFNTLYLRDQQDMCVHSSTFIQLFLVKQLGLHQPIVDHRNMDRCNKEPSQWCLRLVLSTLETRRICVCIHLLSHHCSSRSNSMCIGRYRVIKVKQGTGPILPAFNTLYLRDNGECVCNTSS